MRALLTALAALWLWVDVPPGPVDVYWYDLTYGGVFVFGVDGAPCVQHLAHVRCEGPAQVAIRYDGPPVARCAALPRIAAVQGGVVVAQAAAPRPAGIQCLHLPLVSAP